MNILIMEFKIRVSWVNSLKEKRMIVKSILAKLRNKFNVSVSEVGSHDDHKIIVIGLAGISDSAKILDAMGEKIIDFIEDNNDGEILEIYKNIDKK
ncbi:MAG: DUF503 domain-containing protein [Sarcina sp.]